MAPIARPGVPQRGVGLDYYDDRKGTVFYDKNGDKAGSVVVIATLRRGLDIWANDFVVV